MAKMCRRGAVAVASFTYQGLGGRPPRCRVTFIAVNKPAQSGTLPTPVSCGGRVPVWLLGLPLSECAGAACPKGGRDEASVNVDCPVVCCGDAVLCSGHAVRNRTAEQSVLARPDNRAHRRDTDRERPRTPTQINPEGGVMITGHAQRRRCSAATVSPSPSGNFRPGLCSNRANSLTMNMLTHGPGFVNRKETLC
jgi:hypothetical protein